jgi:nitrite reductase (NO-forming)
MFNHQPTYTWINGIPFGYDPIITKTPGAIPPQFKQGDHVRFFLLNEGDAMVNFHIVGGQLDRVISGSVLQGLGKQTYLLGGSNDAIIDVVFTKAGVFAPVNHDYASLFKGQAGIVVVNGPDGQPGKTLGLKNTLNPSNAIPPMGKDSIPVATTPYTLGTPLKLTSSQIGPLKVCTKEACL